MAETYCQFPDEFYENLCRKEHQPWFVPGDNEQNHLELAFRRRSLLL
jgi:hypothetical protein